MVGCVFDVEDCWGNCSGEGEREFDPGRTRRLGEVREGTRPLIGDAGGDEFGDVSRRGRG
jgi:hypothetical protein